MRKQPCGVEIKFGDNFGDNECTFYCQLEKEHKGKHIETGNMGHGTKKIPYKLAWDGDSRDLD